MLQPLLRMFRRETSEPDYTGLLRLAIVGTPRSGNTWFRRVMASAYNFDKEKGHGRQIAVHDPLEVDWEGEGPRYIVQVHTAKEPKWIEHFKQHKVRLLVVVRHPFDVLISILNYSSKVHDTHLWLAGKGGDETSIRGLLPCDPRFIDYACGPRATALLDVSTGWRKQPGTISLRYEDLVSAPMATLGRIEKSLKAPPEVAWSEAVALNTIDQLRLKDGTSHHWQGNPGHWKNLLTKDVADAIARVHRPLAEAYGYGKTEFADPSLTPEQAKANFEALR